jgi:hypothetical protein
MVGLMTSSSMEYRKDIGTVSAKTSSIDAFYSDPDLLIREYFLSSSAQRCASRKVIIQHIKSLKSIFEILRRGASGKDHDSYDGAVNLLAEIDSFELLRNVSQVAQKAYLLMLGKPSNFNFAESFLEILIKAIANAYKIDADQRLRLLKDLCSLADEIESPTINTLISLQSLFNPLIYTSLPINLDRALNAVNWVIQLKRIAISQGSWWTEPLVNFADSEIVFEWWHIEKKITIYFTEMAIEFIKVWGADMDNEMEEGVAETLEQTEALWKWLAL